MFALQSGVLIPPSAARSLYDPNAYPGSGRTRERALRRGLFNPHLLFGAPVKTMHPNNNDPFTELNLMPDDQMDAFAAFRMPPRSQITMA
jgi:hypothetical protein